MYIPIYKNRLYENKFLREYGSLFETNKIMPYIEIITRKMGRTEYKEEQLIKIYDAYFFSKYFIDFFTFSEKDYTQFNKEAVAYSISARTESPKKYLQKLLATVVSSKAIPVISIKEGKEEVLNERSILFLITSLQQIKPQIAVRIEGKLLNAFYSLLKKNLRKSDYLFFDIKEENLNPYVYELNDLKKDNNFIKILTNSPRKKSINNGSYLKSGYTDLIDNFAQTEYQKQNFSGYADYSGLKDDLPKSGGSRGFGAALAIFYDYTTNKYYTITNTCTKDGLKGYKYVLKNLGSEEVCKKLRLDNCLAYKYIKKNMLPHNKIGNFGVWNFITILRKLSEMKKVYN